MGVCMGNLALQTRSRRLRKVRILQSIVVFLLHPYRQILVSATIDEYELEAVIPPKVFTIAVEKREPFRCGVFDVPDGVLAHFNIKMFSAIESLKQCQSAGHYPTLFEGVRPLNLM